MDLSSLLQIVVYQYKHIVSKISFPLSYGLKSYQHRFVIHRGWCNKFHKLIVSIIQKMSVVHLLLNAN